MLFFNRIHRWLGYFYKVPWCVPAWGWNEFYAIMRCIFSGHIVSGRDVEKFSNAISGFLSIPYVIPVNKGRFAIELALNAIGIGANDDVVVPSYICQSVIEAVRRTGADPVFCDIGPDLHMTERNVKDSITPKTRCVIVPHIFAGTAPIDKIEELLKGLNVALIDDAAQLVGAKCSGRHIGTFGDCGIISCGPGKAIVAPDGGAFVTRSRELYERARSVGLEPENPWLVIRRCLSFLVWRRFRKYTLPLRIILDRLYCLKEDMSSSIHEMSNLDAAISYQQLISLGRNYSKRKQNSEVVMQVLGDIAENNRYAFDADSDILKIVIVMPSEGPSSEKIIGILAEAGIECQKGYNPLHQDPMPVLHALPFTESVWDRVVCVPVDMEYRNPKYRVRMVGTDAELGRI